MRFPKLHLQPPPQNRHFYMFFSVRAWPKNLFFSFKRRRDNNKMKFSLFEGACGAERKIVQNAVFFFRGKRHDNKILKVQILLSRKFVVIAQAPIFAGCVFRRGVAFPK